LICGIADDRLANIRSVCRQSNPVNASSGALEQDVDQFQSCHGVEQLPGKMHGRPCARGAVVELAGIRLGERDQLFHRVRLHLRMRHQRIGALPDQPDRREIALRVIVQLRVETVVNRVRADRAHHDGVAVGRALCAQFRCDVPSRAARLSITSDCPSLSRSAGSIARAMMSAALPIGKGMMTRTGRVGYCWAIAPQAMRLNDSEVRQRRTCMMTPEVWRISKA
jgi:hypothetical protein